MDGMVVTAAQLQLHGSGSGNIGGARSGVQISTGVDQLYDRVTGEESTAGNTDYRIVYVYNANNSNDTATDLRIHLSANYQSSTGNVTNGSPGDIAIAVKEAVGANAPTLTNEGTTPTGLTFTQPISRSAGIPVGDIAPGQFRAVYIRRTVSAGAAAKDVATATIEITADSGE